MITTSITTRLASNGLQQHLYAEPTTVQEWCGGWGSECYYDYDCCGALVCYYGYCQY
jgi:hypothetical protein